MCAKLTIDQARERVRHVNPDDNGVIHNWANRRFLEALFIGVKVLRQRIDLLKTMVTEKVPIEGGYLTRERIVDLARLILYGNIGTWLYRVEETQLQLTCTRTLLIYCLRISHSHFSFLPILSSTMSFAS
jgi:hypothetical protein